MDDIYIVRDEKRVMALKGHRSSGQRRGIGPAPRLVRYGSRILKNRRDLTDRRHFRALTFKERVFERISSLTNGVALLAIGLFFLLTGLTFLPVVGLFIGVYIIFQSVVVMAEALHKIE